MMEFQARLIIDDGTEHPLVDTLTVGRSDSCDITLPSSKVSRQHARFKIAEGGVTIEDLDSSNGTRLNGRAIDSPQTVMDGDRVSIDTFTVTVVIASATAGESGDDAAMIAAPADDDATVLAPAAEESSAAEEPPAVNESPAPSHQSLPGSDGEKPASAPGSRLPLYIGGAIVVALVIAAVAFL
ncbi:MAG: FHA domain-containing protein [Chromatocurvus sp.]